MSRSLLSVTLIGITLEQLESALGGKIYGEPQVSYLWDDGVIRPFPVDSLPTGTKAVSISVETDEGFVPDSEFLAVPFGFENPWGPWFPTTWGNFAEEEWEPFKGQGLWIWRDEEWEPF